MRGEKDKIIAGFTATRANLTTDAHACRGGYRQVCKKCRNRERADWARRRYVPKTGRRYQTKADRATVAGA